jgi:lipase maturation factor 1
MRGLCPTQTDSRVTLSLNRIRDLLRRRPESDHLLIRSLFLRALGFVYFCAFASLWIQVSGLAGQHGILPVAEFLRDAAEQLTGVQKYYQIPTLCWISPSDASLLAQCAFGTLFSLILMAGFLPAFIVPALWVLWLSLTTACRDFLGFQWENLLLESGLLAIFFAPPTLSLKSSRRPSMFVIWLFRWLLFRLMFLSGMVKLLSGDSSWRDFTALSFHYQTQPLPTLFGWYAHDLPLSFHRIETGVMYVIELAVPFLIFAGRRGRITGAILIVLLQMGIAITGNHCYFNLLTIILCVLLCDDKIVSRLLPGIGRPISPPSATTPVVRIRRATLITAGTIVLLVSVAETATALQFVRRWPTPIAELIQGVQPFRSINNYGLFAVMTKTRPEIIIEGSDDGQNWLAYEFRYKPGQLKRRLRFVAPHQPRLDWQMWFAALSSYQQNPWFVNFCIRLLEGQAEVLKLLRDNPFPKKPPKYLRAVLYRYEFTTPEARRTSGEWWMREYLGNYFGPVTLNRQSSVPTEEIFARP